MASPAIAAQPSARARSTAAWRSACSDCGGSPHPPWTIRAAICQPLAWLPAYAEKGTESDARRGEALQLLVDPVLGPPPFQLVAGREVDETRV